MALSEPLSVPKWRREKKYRDLSSSPRSRRAIDSPMNEVLRFFEPCEATLNDVCLSLTFFAGECGSRSIRRAFQDNETEFYVVNIDILDKGSL